MATFNDLMQKFVNSDYETLVGFGQQALVKLLPICKKVDPEHEGFFMVSSIILAAIGADGVLTGLEKKFLGDVMGLKDENVDTFIKMYDSKMVELVDRFVDDINDEIKAHTVMLVSAVCAVDEKISREETAFIHKLLA